MDEWLTARQAARELRISPREVLRLAERRGWERRQLDATPRSPWLFRRADVAGEVARRQSKQQEV